MRLHLIFFDSCEDCKKIMPVFRMFIDGIFLEPIKPFIEELFPNKNFIIFRTKTESNHHFAKTIRQHRKCKKEIEFVKKD